GMRGRIGAQPLLEVIERTRAGEVELQRRKAEAQHMAMRVDQAGKQRPAPAIDRIGGQLRKWLADGKRADHLPVVTNQKRRKMLQLAVGPDLDAVDVADERIG